MEFLNRLGKRPAIFFLYFIIGFCALIISPAVPQAHAESAASESSVRQLMDRSQQLTAGDPDKAVELAENALEEARSLGHEKLEADALNNLAFVYYRLNRLDLARTVLREALETGPYGRCVYLCDNDVVDHQVVNMEFEGGRTATFTMTAFTEAGGRKTRIFGTRGQIEGDGREIRVFDFLTDRAQTVDTEAGDASIPGGHGGGDHRLMSSFISAVANNDPEMILSGAAETLETHLMVFAAERARREGTVVQVPE